MKTLRRMFARRDTAPDTKGQTRFILSTPAEARDGHMIDQGSWDTTEYQANPVVLWAHDDRSPPVGRMEGVGLDSGNLMGTAIWDVASERGYDVARQYDEGFLNAVSVRWFSNTMVQRNSLPKDDPSYSDNPRSLLFRDNVLVEVSAVPVPSDAGALAQRGLTPPAPSSLEFDELMEWVRANIPTRSPVEDVLAALDDPRIRAKLEGRALALPVTDWFQELKARGDGR